MFKKGKFKTFSVVYNECLSRIKTNIYWMFLILYYAVKQTTFSVSATSSN